MDGHMLLHKREPKRPIISSCTSTSSMVAKLVVPFPCADFSQTSGAWGIYIKNKRVQLSASSDVVCALRL
jgi:hypothetical protein